MNYRHGIFLILFVILLGCGGDPGNQKLYLTNSGSVFGPCHHVTKFICEGHDYIRFHFAPNGNEYYSDPVVHSPDCQKCNAGKNNK